MTRRKTTADADAWRNELLPGDVKALLSWIEISGIDCVARVATALTNAPGSGPPPRPDVDLLLELARRHRESPEQSIHDIALEVAQEGPEAEARTIEPVNLAKRLQRKFESDRPKWWMLLRNEEQAGREPRSARAPNLTAPEQRLVVDRIVQLLPTAIDPFDMLLSEVPEHRHDLVSVVKRNRGRVTELLGAALKLQFTSRTQHLVNGKVPRNFFDLIEPDLDLMKLTEIAARSKRGRNPAF